MNNEQQAAAAAAEDLKKDQAEQLRRVPLSDDLFFELLMEQQEQG